MDTIHVTDFGAFLGKHSERLVIRKGKETLSEHPLMNLEQVLVESRAGSISWDLIHECCQRGIPITLLGRGGAPVARLVSPALAATVKTRREQLAAFLDERGVAVARAMAQGKVHNQANTIRYFAKYRKASDAAVHALVEADATAIRDLERQISKLSGATIDEIRPALLNLEGRAGAAYWHAAAALLGDKAPMERREHRGTSSATNAMFNYGYGILQSQVWTALTLAGLEPFAGFLHVDRPGRPSLVLDFMEEFRQPIVDRALIAAVGKGLTVRFDEEDESGGETAGEGAAPLNQRESSVENAWANSPVREESPAPTASDPGASETTAPPSNHARFLCVESKRAVAERVLARLDTKETYRDQKQTLRNIIQLQARHLAVALRGETEYRPFTISW